jgi:hypothetical protein
VEVAVRRVTQEIVAVLVVVVTETETGLVAQE